MQLTPTVADPALTIEAPPATLAYEPGAEHRHTVAGLIGTVGIKLLGLYLMLELIRLIPLLWYPFLGPNPNPSGTAVVLQYVGFATPQVLLAGAGWWLFRSATRLSARWFGTISDAPAPLSASTLMGVLIIAIGLFSIMLAVPDIMRGLANAIAFRSAPGAFTRYSDVLPIVVPGVVQLLFGVLLIRFADRLSRIGLSHAGGQPLAPPA